MKRKLLVPVLLAEALLLAVLVILAGRHPEWFSSLLAFPLEQIAHGLGVLSGRGWLGNGIAAVLYVAAASIPALAALHGGRERESLPERISLFVLSGVLLFTLYGMTHPALFSLFGGDPEGDKLVKAALGACAWSFVVLYVIMRLMRLFRKGSKEQLIGYMRKLLCALAVLFTGACAIQLADTLLGIRGTAQSGLDRGMGLLRMLAVLLPYVLDVLVILRAMALIDTAAGEDREALMNEAEKLSRACCRALALTAAVTAAANLLQTVLMRRLTEVSVAAEIPVVSVSFVVLILLFARLLTENRKLRDDNDLFI
ncbi:MAG: hypothetical protein J5859_02175 [Clostridia bacterium]|nr:hypothetical protein [Clostridia bacterium]